MSTLITGGAGYIGSVTVELMRKQDRDVVVLDNLTGGHQGSLDGDVKFYIGDVGDPDLVKHIIEANKVDSCIHFAAYANVSESVSEPSKYFENNTFQTNILLKTLIGANVKQVVFSSTCSTYGEPQKVPIGEGHRQVPVNPYGWSKFMTERILESFDAAYGLKSVALRYFNAAGATAKCGEHHDPETHLIPLLLNVANGDLPHISVFGNDYSTPDGTCIRDYVHVADLADAHIKALEYLRRGGESTQLNLGTGRGYSVFEAVETAQSVTGRNIPMKVEPRRDGDPDQLVADSAKAYEVLGWEPSYTCLESIIKTAWAWKQAHPQGYKQD